MIRLLIIGLLFLVACATTEVRTATPSQFCLDLGERLHDADKEDSWWILFIASDACKP